ncbi:MAG: amidohydrolase [Holophaga sp.]
MKPAAADLVLKNVKVYTVDPEFRVAECLAVAGGRIVDVGPEARVLERWTPAQVVDGKGRWVYPGLMDPHSHLFGYAISLGNADLTGARSWEETVDRVREHQRKHPTAWAQGRGWNQEDWPGQAFPTRDLLDRAFPDQPVLLVRVDGHAAVVNGAALALAGVDERTRVDGGEFTQSAGRLTGLLIDNAIERVRQTVPLPDREARERALLQAQGNCFQVGLTSVCDAGISLDEVLLLDDLHQAGRFKLRVYAMLDPTQENYDHFLARGVYVTDRLTVRSVKTYADGALGSRGALLLQPYQDDPINRGLQLASREALDAICRRAHAAGYQVCTHCIGDAAVRLMLDLYTPYLEPGNDRRWRIEHAQIIDPEDLHRFGRHGVVPSVQTTHATSDMRWAAERLGPRLKHGYRYQELLGENGWLPNGSDFPVERIDPLLGFYAAVARKDARGWPEGGFQMENALTREQALRAMTIWAARANFEEAGRGSLEPGKWADFVILDRDLMTVPEPELLSARVVATYLGGEKVYAR